MAVIQLARRLIVKFLVKPFLCLLLVAGGISPLLAGPAQAAPFPDGVVIPGTSPPCMFRTPTDDLKTVCRNTTFDKVVLPNENFENADFTGSTFIGGDFGGANFKRAKLTNTKFVDGKFAGAVFDGVSLNQASLGEADMTGASLIEADLSLANAAGANLRRVRATRMRALGTNFDRADLERADLSDAILGVTMTDPGTGESRSPRMGARRQVPRIGSPRASFRWANLSGANLSNSNDMAGPLNATGAGVDFSHADMTDANLTGTNMAWARLYAAKMNGTASQPDTRGATFMPNQSIAAGYLHSCRIDAAGLVECWGFNGAGQLGRGDTADSRQPVKVQKGSGGYLSDVVAVAAGGYHSCALNVGGRVYCWGDNDSGQLGFNGGSKSATAVQVPLENVVSITAGGFHSCAIDSNREVFCWGKNDFGQLGNGSDQKSATPSRVQPPSAGMFRGRIAVSAGENHTCSVSFDGHAFCWGRNIFGQLGTQSSADSPLPSPVVLEPTPIPQSSAQRRGPMTPPTPLGGIVAITAGGSHSCALHDQGQVLCWGWNGSGQLGNGTRVDSRHPVVAQQVVPHDANALRGSQSHTLVADLRGTAGAMDEIDVIAAGNSKSCALKANGQIFCWGFGQVLSAVATQQPSGQTFGRMFGQAPPTPTREIIVYDDKLATEVRRRSTTPAKVDALAVGFGHVCVNGPAGFSGWGRNQYGQLGDGTTNDSALRILS